MSTIAGPTAGPNWLKCFLETHGFPGGRVTLAKKISLFKN